MICSIIRFITLLFGLTNQNAVTYVVWDRNPKIKFKISSSKISQILAPLKLSKMYKAKPTPNL